MSQNPWAELRKLVLDAAEKAASEIIAPAGAIKLELEEPNKSGFGDFALACFEIAKYAKRPPADIAKELAEKIKVSGADAKAIGPYVNFYIDWLVWSRKILGSINPKYGRVAKTSKMAVVDFSSPNPAHPFHMGTVRSTILGEALSRILESQGWSVKRLCYINDLGRQAAIALLGYKTYASGERPLGKPDVWLGKIYFRTNEAVESSPTMQERAEEVLRECEKGMKGYADIGKKLVDWCIEGFSQNWKIMGIRFDKLVYESQFIRRSKEIVARLKEKGLTFESDGATVLNLEPHGLPNTIVLRSDGTALYLTRDIAFALWRNEQWRPDLNIYITAEDQKLHFQQLFKTLDLLGYPELAKRSRHLAYSMVLLEGKKMSSRAGRVVLWDELLAEGTKKVAERMAPEKGEPEWKARLKADWVALPEGKKRERAQENALAAIKYFILRYGPEKPVDFHWDAALAMEGDTGPYLQYTHARACAVIKKASRIKSLKGVPDKPYGDAREQAVLKLLAQYPDVLKRAAADMRPHYLSNYLFSLADAFNKFYEVLPVLRTDSKTRAARLKLVKAVRLVLANGLKLLAIPAPEKM